MLVLSRNRFQIVDIDIGSGIVLEVHVMEIRPDKVRLGFVAPKHIAINRREVTVRDAQVPQESPQP